MTQSDGIIHNMVAKVQSSLYNLATKIQNGIQSIKNRILDFVNNVKTKGVAYLKEKIKDTYETFKNNVTENFIKPFQSKQGITELIERVRARVTGVSVVDSVN